MSLRGESNALDAAIQANIFGLLRRFTPRNDAEANAFYLFNITFCNNISPP